jgi:hypothetical protein
VSETRSFDCSVPELDSTMNAMSAPFPASHMARNNSILCASDNQTQDSDSRLRALSWAVSMIRKAVGSER